MGKMESEARTERRRGYLQNAVLTTIGVVGILAVAMVAPNTLQLLGALKGKRFGEQANSAASRLARKGHIRFIEMNGKKFLRITPAGKRALEKMQYEASLREVLKRSHKWDKRWRMIVFDIPERHRTARKRLRDAVRSLGFLRVQDSVWLYPYDCEDLIVLLKSDMRLGKEVLYAIVEKIENDKWIKAHFGLPT